MMAFEPMMAAKPAVSTKPMMAAEAMMAAKPMVPTKSVGAPSGVPAPDAGYEQHCQHHDDAHPQGWAASALLSLLHRAFLPRLPVCVPSKTPLLTTWQHSSTDRRARGS